MTVFVVYDSVRYEGSSPPLAAFSTREAAESYCEIKRNEDPDARMYSDQTWHVVELTLDAALHK